MLVLQFQLPKQQTDLSYMATFGSQTRFELY